MTYLGASAGALVVDRNAWHTRADQAWGTSRVWNSGSSFETDLAAMTTDRNNWQSSSNTWQGRANNAWGASRVWSSGESWEAAYTRVLPAGSGQTPATLDVALTNLAVDGVGRVLGSTTLNRTGVWHISWAIQQMGTAGGTPDGGGARWSYMELRTDTNFTAGAGTLGAWLVSHSTGTDSSAGGQYRAVMNNGTPVYLMIRAGDAAGSNAWKGPQPYMYLTFVPTQSYPH